jgi:predicted aldo/keto reductase-like oxidoreductase
LSQNYFDKILDEQLNRLQTKSIDFYLLHGLDKSEWHDVVLKFQLLERAEAAIRDGRIKHLGFSFHDCFDSFQEIIDGYDRWDFCQIQYNYMDIESQAGIKGLRYAAAKGLAVIIMEPLLGGRLANPPKSVSKRFADFKIRRTPADWALQWIWNQPEVSLVLSGMSSIEQVQENIGSANISGVNQMDAEELQLFHSVRTLYQERTAIPCTECSYCMPCPNGVDIPKNFKIYNDGYMHDDLITSRGSYKRFVGESSQAGQCIQCRQCEERCPQKIPIADWMPKVHGVLGESKAD